MLLRLWAYRAIIDESSAGDDVCSVINQDGRIHKVAIRVLMTDPDLSCLASRPGHAILVALGTRCRVKDWTEPGAGIMSSFKLRLVESKTVARRLCYPVADALRTRILRKRWSSEASWRLGCVLFRHRDKCNSDGD